MTKTAALTDAKIDTARADRAKRLGLDVMLKKVKAGSPEHDALCLKRDRFILTDTRNLYLDFDYTRKDVSKRCTWRCWVPNGKGGRTKSLIGYYPEVGIEDARKAAAADRQDVTQQQLAGTALVTPSVKRRLQAEDAAAKAAEAAQNAQRAEQGEYLIGTFGALAKDVYEHDVDLWKGGATGITGMKFTSTMERWVKGHFDRKHVTEVTEDDIDALRRRILTAKTKNRSKGGKTALKHALRFVGYVFDEAIDRKLIKVSPIVEPKRKNAQKKQRAGKSVKHPGVTTLPMLGRLVRSILAESMPSRFDARDAMFITLATAQRRYTIINMEWAEIDWDKCEWVIPREKMKLCGDDERDDDEGVDTSAQPHHVPLSRQCMDLLTMRWNNRMDSKRKSPFVFPSRTIANDLGKVNPETGVRRAPCGMSDSLISEMLNDGHQQGLPSWKGVHTPHGSRTTFRTLCRKLEGVGDYLTINGSTYSVHLLAEIQLDHTHGEAIKEMTANMPGTYFQCDAFEERAVLMQKWSDLLEKLASEADPEDSGTMRLGTVQAALPAPAQVLLAA